MTNKIDWSCADCKFNTKTEYYMVHNKLWRLATHGEPIEFLCIGCLECRIGRELEKTDFTDAPINQLTYYIPKIRSLRLISRLTGNANLKDKLTDWLSHWH